MAHLEESIMIDAPVKSVFELAVDPRRWSTWWSGLGEAEEIEGDGGPQTRVEHSYLLVGIHFPVHTRVLEKEWRDEGWGHWKGEFSGPIEGWHTWDYRSKDGGTEVTTEMEYSIPGKALGKVADKMIVERMQQKAIRETLERLKLLAEA